MLVGGQSFLADLLPTNRQPPFHIVAAQVEQFSGAPQHVAQLYVLPPPITDRGLADVAATRGKRARSETPPDAAPLNHTRPVKRMMVNWPKFSLLDTLALAASTCRVDEDSATRSHKAAPRAAAAAAVGQTTVDTILRLGSGRALGALDTLSSLNFHPWHTHFPR